MTYPITRQFGPNAKGSELTFADMDNNLLYLDAKVTGSNNYIALFSGSSAVSSSVIYQSTGLIGINTTSPSVDLDVKGTTLGGKIRIQNNITTDFAQLLFSGSSTNLASIFLNGSTQTAFAGANSFNVYQGSNAPLAFWTNATERIRIDSSGNVGIGKTSPNALLDVNGNTIITGSLTTTGNATITGSLNLSEDFSGGNIYSNRKVKIGDATTPSRQLEITNSGSLAPTIRLNNTSSNSYYDITHTGNLFINKDGSNNGLVIASGSGGGGTIFTTSSITLEAGTVDTYTTTNFGTGTYILTYFWNGGDDISILDGSPTGSVLYSDGYGTPPLTSSFVFTTTNGYITFRTEGFTTAQVNLNVITIASFIPNVRIGINKASGSTINATGLDISGSLVISGSTLITDVLTLPQVSPLPSGRPTGSLAVSGSGTACKIYFFNGSWNALF